MGLVFVQTFVKYIEHLLQNDDNMSSWLSCTDGHNLECVPSWAEETIRDALTWTYVDENGYAIKNGAFLSEDHFLTRLRTITRRLETGGV